MKSTERVFNRYFTEKAVSCPAAVFFPAAVQVKPQAKPYPASAERWSFIIAGQLKNVQGCVKVPHTLPIIISKTNAGFRWILVKTQGGLNLLEIPAPRKENPKFLMLP